MATPLCNIPVGYAKMSDTEFFFYISIAFFSREILRGFINRLRKFIKVARNKICFIKADKQLFNKRSITTGRKYRAIGKFYNFYNE